MIINEKNMTKHSLSRQVTIRFIGLIVGLVGLGALLSIAPWQVNAVDSTVSGTVYDQGSTPVVGAQVCVHGPVGECTMSGVGGAYSFTQHPLPAGRYDGQATPAAGDPTYGPSLRVQFDVTDGITNAHDFHLTTIQMMGRFTKADGTGLRGGLNVYNADYSTNIHVESNDNGDYTMGGFPAGTYTVQPTVGGDVTGLIAPDPSEVTLTTDGTVVTKNFTFSAAAKTITGNVSRKSGGVVANACVNANKMNGQGWANANTDAAGNYTMSLSGGSWNVQVNACNSDADWIYSGAPIMIDFVQDGTIESKATNFSVTTTTSSISGTVTDQNGVAVTSGSINFRTQDNSEARGDVNASGSYSVRMTGGTYNVNFWSQNNAYNLPQTTVTLAEGESKIFNLVVQAKTAHIQGTVKDAAGAVASNVMINANEMTNTPGKQGAWGNARSDASGNFDMLVTPGTYNINIGTEPNSSYVWVNPSQIQIIVPAATSVITPADYSVLNFVVAKADATITGKLTAGGNPINNAPLCVWARPVGVMNQNCSPLQPNGTFSIKVSSAGGTSFEMGCFSPPNMPYSCPQAVPVTIVAGGSVAKDMDLTMNNSSIVGQLYDQSGFPLSSCESFRGGRVFADNPGGNGAHYEGEIGTDCKYRISLVAGVYFMNSFFPPDSGVMNSPPGAPVQVFSGQTVQKNIMVAKADAYVTVKLLDKNGNGMQGWINVDNNEEINMSREGNKGPGGDQGGKGADLGFGKKMPCGATDMQGIMKCCKDTKNKTQCVAFAIPEGPNGCKNAYTCVQLCVKDPKICDEANKGNTTAGPQPGEGTFVAGPGGCKSDAECQKYCSEPANQDECAKFKQPAGVQSQSVSTKGLYEVKSTRIISSVPVKASAEAKTVVAGDKGAGFDKGIQSSGSTDQQGNAKILVLSGHKYKVCAGLPPESNMMPPKCQTADLTSVKSASVALQVRDADAQLTGTVTLPSDALATRCFVHAWAEDGSFSGQPCAGNGSYKLNLTADTTWHFGADSMDGSKFYRSEETSLVVVKGTKTYTQNLKLIEGNFEIPQPVTTSGECSSPLVLSMSNGAKISIPAGGLSTATSGSCSCTATPTIDLISTKSNQPQGAGYTIDCRDENNAQVTQLKSSATITVPYSLSKSEEGTSIEDALKPVLYQSDTQSYKTVDSYTLDKENNLITFSVDHFSAYTVSNSSGMSSKNAALSSVTTAKNSKTGITTFTVNKKKVTPFPKCKGSVQLTTKSVKGTQLIAVGSSCDGALKVYGTNGKSMKTIATGWKGIATLNFTDVNKDGNADIIAAATSGKDVRVISVAQKYKAFKVAASSGVSQLTATAIDLRGNGISSLVTATVKNGQASGFRIYNYSKKGFSVVASSPYSAYLRNSNGSIALNVTKPTVKTIKGSVKATATAAKVTITGTGFTPDTAVLIGDIGAKVTFKSTTQMTVSFDATKLSAGKYVLKLTNPGGQSTTTKQKVVVQ